MTEQLDLFQAPSKPSATEAREIERFGMWDARCGAPLRSFYSDRLDAGRLEIYERAFRAERMKDIATQGEQARAAEKCWHGCAE